MDLRTTEQEPPLEDYLSLRIRAGLSPKSVEAAQRRLGNSLYSISIFKDESLVGMGRVLGDGGCHYHIVDIAVDPDLQGHGLGRKIISRLVDYLNQSAPSGAYKSLIADQPKFYEKFGFSSCAPEAEGMYMRIP